MTAPLPPLPDDKPLRMSAYYYSFKPTGQRKIDEILSAVACAGKGFHHTEDWANPGIDGGPSYIEKIQTAAIAAAAELAEARAEIERLRSNFAEYLQPAYAANPVSVARLCDEKLDQTGQLLGMLRAALAPEKEER